MGWGHVRWCVLCVCREVLCVSLFLLEAVKKKQGTAQENGLNSTFLEHQQKVGGGQQRFLGWQRLTGRHRHLLRITREAIHTEVHDYKDIKS